MLLHDLHNRAHPHEQDAINSLILQLTIAGYQFLEKYHDSPSKKMRIGDISPCTHFQKTKESKGPNSQSFYCSERTGHT